MTAFVTWGYKFASDPLPPAPKAEEPKTTPAPTKSPEKHTHDSFNIPRWLSLGVKIILGILVAVLCVTGVIFLTDFFEATMGQGGFLPRASYPTDGPDAVHGFGVYDSAGNGHHGTNQPAEWCNKHPRDCHWTDLQARSRGAAEDGRSHWGPLVFKIETLWERGLFNIRMHSRAREHKRSVTRQYLKRWGPEEVGV
ncbi:hypothetical protein LX36DRAFT_699096 [Colletotrichum falcatum]|nr:hypothetical protein LX36DRAFT_699096 [Colletotrichum falcatum]